jgi:hypothetical protein
LDTLELKVRLIGAHGYRNPKFDQVKTAQAPIEFSLGKSGFARENCFFHGFNFCLPIIICPADHCL